MIIVVMLNYNGNLHDHCHASGLKTWFKDKSKTCVIGCCVTKWSAIQRVCQHSSIQVIVVVVVC